MWMIVIGVIGNRKSHVCLHIPHELTDFYAESAPFSKSLERAFSARTMRDSGVGPGNSSAKRLYCSKRRKTIMNPNTRCDTQGKFPKVKQMLFASVTTDPLGFFYARAHQVGKKIKIKKAVK